MFEIAERVEEHSEKTVRQVGTPIHSENIDAFIVVREGVFQSTQIGKKKRKEARYKLKTRLHLKTSAKEN